MAAGITFVGTIALKALNENADNISVTARRSLVAARAAQNVLGMNRAEFRSALDPRVENRGAMLRNSPRNRASNTSRQAI